MYNVIWYVNIIFYVKAILKYNRLEFDKKKLIYILQLLLILIAH